MNKVEPIKPSEITQEIPDWVIEGANACIKKHYRELDKESHFTQDELIDFVLAAYPGNKDDINRQVVFDNCWLDIEPVYRKVGWTVIYDKPAYCESYPANFTFKINKR